MRNISRRIQINVDKINHSNIYTFNCKVCINEMGEFIGLQPKGGELNA